MNEKPEIEVGKLPVITKFIYTLGVLPTSYLMSMTYQEQVTWIYNYLQTQVIPLLNTESAAIQELQNLYELLRTYVNDYFDNLDVQEEINNKLDDLVRDGTIQNILSNQYNDLMTQVNNELNDFSNRLESVASGSPLIANSTSEMTDTSRVYVNTSDGKWYYYNGTAWTIGGTYQSTEIANNSIDFRKLDTELNGLFYKGISFKDIGDEVSGHFLTVSNNALVVNNNANWSYNTIDISSYIGKILYYSTVTFGTNYGLIITDNSNNVLWHSDKGVGSDYTNSNGYITIPENSKYLYLQQNISIRNFNVSDDINRIFFHEVGIVDKLKQIINYNNKTLMTPINSIEDYYISTASQSVGNRPTLSYYSSNYSTKIYKIYKGLKYQISGYNFQTTSSYVITDNNYIASAVSGITYNQNEEFIHEFTCLKDGYIVACTHPEHPTSVNVYDTLTTDEDTSLSQYKVGFTGDSICYGAGYTGGYAKILNEEYGLRYQNIGVSGGHIAHDRDDVFIISNSIPNIDSDVNALIMEGGINDYSNYVPTGTLTGNYTDAIDQTKFTGALEKLFRDAVSYFPNIPKSFVIIHNVNQSKVKLPNDIHRTEYPNGEIIDFQYFVDVIYTVANKYGIEVIDIGKNAGMNTYNQTIKNNYTMAVGGVHDGLHPNKNGYTKFYIPYIKEWLDKVLK